MELRYCNRLAVSLVRLARQVDIYRHLILQFECPSSRKLATLFVNFHIRQD